MVNLTKQKVESHQRLGPNVHSPADVEEIVVVERAVLEDPGVKAEIAKLKLPEGTVVVCDPWIYGTYTGTQTVTPNLLTKTRLRWP